MKYETIETMEYYKEPSEMDDNSSCNTCLFCMILPNEKVFRCGKGVTENEDGSVEKWFLCNKFEEA